MSYSEFDLGKPSSPSRRHVKEATCPLITILSGILVAYILIPLLIEVVLGTLMLLGGILSIIFKKRGNWWNITLIVLGVITLVATWIFPVWIMVLVLDPVLLAITIIGWVIFGVAIGIYERNKRNPQKRKILQVTEVKAKQRTSKMIIILGGATINTAHLIGLLTFIFMLLGGIFLLIAAPMLNIDFQYRQIVGFILLIGAPVGVIFALIQGRIESLEEIENK